LEIIDPILGDTGTLISWSITLKVKGTPGTTVFTEPYTVTDTNGNYSFTDLPPGLYAIREYVQPDQELAGWQNTWSPPPITVTNGFNVTDYDFGNWIPDPNAQLRSIKGQIYYDANNNGVKNATDPALPGWVVYIDGNNNGVRDVSATSTVIASTDVPKPIEDFKTTKSQIVVTDPGSVFNVELTLDLTHTFVGDLEAYLTSPSGRQVLLFSHDGGQYNDFHNLTFSDNGARSISTIGFNDLPYTGIWQPDGLSFGHGLSYFGGENAAGIWTLSITDSEAGDEGILNSWSLNFGSGELFRTTDASGNYQFDSLNAGSYVIREELKPGWTQIPPMVTTIPGATWTNLHWNATVNSLAVQNVDFGNFSAVALAGDYDRNGVVDAMDQVLWRKTLGMHVPSFSGADGDGNGIVEQADLAVWRANYGRTLQGSGSGNGLATVAAGSGAEARSVEVSDPAPAATAPEPLSTEQAPLPSQVASDVIVVTTSDSAQSSAVEGSQPVPAAPAPEAPVPAVTVLEPLSTEQASSSQVASDVIVVTTSDSANSPAGSIQVFELVGPNSAIEHGAMVIERPSESTSRSDLGLLAWLAASSVGERPQPDVMSLSDNDLAASHLGDEAETVDVAFELLEGNALAAAAI
jgi:subtilisin-like proprotein convertase family protein